MNICVVGWYFFQDLCKLLEDVTSSHPVTVISHKPVVTWPYDLNVVETENVGLEFGAYDYFLKNTWRGGDTLFIHDDTNVLDIRVFDEIAKLKEQNDIDQAYIFRNKAEEHNNGGKHGRAIFCSDKYLKFILGYTCVCYQSEDHEDKHHNKGTVLPGTGPHTGFWYDPNNYGHHVGKPPVGVRHYNDGVYHYHWQLGRIRDRKCGNEPMNVVRRVFFPDLDCARRGRFRVEVDRRR